MGFSTPSAVQARVRASPQLVTANSDHLPAQAHNPASFNPIFSAWVGNGVGNQKEKG
jgi:hypothetical protein